MLALSLSIHSLHLLLIYMGTALAVTMAMALSPLDSYIHQLSQEGAAFPNSQESLAIRKDVETMIQLLCSHLSKYRMFKNCKYLPIDSTYEGAKIGHPDEFDYMVELPALAEDKIIEFIKNDLDPHIVKYTVQNLDFFNDIFESVNEISDPESKPSTNSEELMGNVFDCIHTLVKAYLKENLLPNWEWIQLAELFTTSGTMPQIAITLILKWHGTEYNDHVVSIDISLAIPIKMTVLREQLITLHVFPVSKQKKKLELSYEVHQALFRDNKTCRKSFSIQEQHILMKYSLSDGQNVCFRVAKCLLDCLATKEYHQDSSELTSNISTYWLKTIIFHQYNKYTSSENWEHQHYGQRVLEIFNVLLDSLKQQRLMSYIIPNYNLLFLKLADQKQRIKDIQNLLNLLLSIQRCEDNAMANIKLQTKEKEMIASNVLYKGRRKTLLDYLYVYAYNDFNDEKGLDTIRRYCEHYLKSSIKITGENNEIVVMENGHKMDIDAELEIIYGDKFSYFK